VDFALQKYNYFFTQTYFTLKIYAFFPSEPLTAPKLGKKIVQIDALHIANHAWNDVAKNA
jgi:hypothetical protein